MDQTRLQYLFKRYFDKTASREEIAELADLLNRDASKEESLRLFNDTWEQYEGDGEIIAPERTEEILQQILYVPQSAGRPQRRYWLYAAAAIIILCMAIGFKYWTSPLPHAAGIAAAAKDVVPGTYKASLLLADGRRIVLDSAAAGQLAQQGNTTIVNKNGRLAYQTAGNGPGGAMYNTLSTSNGETYTFTLADGSQVWLNSGSSVRFPVSFTGNQRLIEATGEVYIEVARDPRKSFVVSVNHMQVQALGTEFDINAYPDEADVKTTLVQGSVKVSEGTAATLLRPGQQTRLLGDGRLSPAKTVDIDEVISWKEGNFEFGNADIKSILRQLARWYDVEVVYEGRPVTDKKFFCVVSRKSTLVNVLKMLRESDLEFRIDGKKLYVSSK